MLLMLLDARLHASGRKRRRPIRLSHSDFTQTLQWGCSYPPGRENSAISQHPESTDTGARAGLPVKSLDNLKIAEKGDNLILYVWVRIRGLCEFVGEKDLPFSRL